MAFTAKEEKSNLPLIPADVHRAVAYALYDLGTHYDKKFDKSTHQCLIIWELPDERMAYTKDGKEVNLPRAISKKYTLSLGEKSNLRKDLQSWRGKVFSEQELQGFDLKSILGANCMLQVIHKKSDEKTYANIATILPLYKGIPSAQPENPIQCFTMEESMEIPEFTPQWIKDVILESDEMKAFAGGESQTPSTESAPIEDVPF
jgi:hypothetical protein